MTERKDAGGNDFEVIPPQPTGNKATVMMNIQIMVEVQETDDWNDMEEQAKQQLRKRVIGAKGFHPFRSHCDTIHPDVEVEELKYHTEVQRRDRW